MSIPSIWRPSTEMLRPPKVPYWPRALNWHCSRLREVWSQAPSDQGKVTVTEKQYKDVNRCDF